MTSMLTIFHRWLRTCQANPPAFTKETDGGADRNRTCDLLIANETLYQLSYDPIHGADVDTLGIDEWWRNYEVRTQCEE
jgi:hypothetical protein